ncbi:MAG: hypothetical protein A2939_02435 [Parcubacteria group bacterium RIFCSPLOWO2_01_FULL_48_18]|nr:MAG: hypothetical protein A3J67_01615 [Parcubacteria group bacterium RIFCSPHIGHO2_02_FULL_48_10b]OHB23245.1 MAG: hypothetical protein A2939_02435 [Parcubacteria group bacterium RIFCSPLOWO2_01_FULL_48_18]
MLCSKDQRRLFLLLCSLMIYAGAARAQDFQSMYHERTDFVVQFEVKSVIDGNMVSVTGGVGSIVDRSETHYYIVTNNHIVEDFISRDTVKGTITVDTAQYRIFVYFRNGYPPVSARVLGRTKDGDLVLLEAPVHPLLPSIEPGKLVRQKDVREGDHVLIIGNPHGIPYHYDEGYVGRVGIISWRASVYFFSIRYPAAPGVSGSPVINKNGEIIAIMKGWFPASRPQEPVVNPIPLAIPAEFVIRLLPRMKKGEDIRHGYLSFALKPVSDLSSEERKFYQVPNNVKKGVYVMDIFAGGAAERAGLREGDVITRFDNKEPQDSHEVLDILFFEHSESDKIPIVIYRKGQKLTITAILGPEI